MSNKNHFRGYPTHSRLLLETEPLAAMAKKRARSSQMDVEPGKAARHNRLVYEPPRFADGGREAPSAKMGRSFVLLPRSITDLQDSNF
jgi:hypothetical protein